MTAESPLESIPDDAVLLVTGPPMTGKYQLLLELLARTSGRTIIVSTKNRAERVREDFREVAPDVPDDHVGIVDCVSHQQTVGEVVDTERTKYATSPENVTRIGVRFTELYEAFYEESDGGHAGVGLHSLSQIVMHADLKTVYQFLQVLVGQIRSAEWFGVAAIDASVIDEEDLQTIQHHFDGVVETRENEAGKRQYRVRGIEPQASNWVSF